MYARQKQQTAEYSANEVRYHHLEQSQMEHIKRYIRSVMAIIHLYLRRITLAIVCVIMVINTVFTFHNVYAVSGLVKDNISSILINRLDTIVKTYQLSE